MSNLNISYSIPQGDVDAIWGAINTLKEKLPFLVSMDSKEVKGKVKLGPKSADFVADAQMAAKQFPEIFPATFNFGEYEKDTKLFAVLNDLKMQLDSISEKVDDTLILVGSEAMTASLEVYSYVRTAAKRTPGLKTVADKLRERFKGQGPQSSAPETEE